MDSVDAKLVPETKKRRLKTPFQLQSLEKFYSEANFPSEAIKARISIELGLSDKQVQGWFCHRRLKDKKLKKEALNNFKHPLGSDHGSPASCNGLKQECLSSGKTGKQHFNSTPEEDGKHHAVRAVVHVKPGDYAAAVLASEVRDHEFLSKKNECKRKICGGSNMIPQEIAPTQNIKPYKTEASKQPLQTCNLTEITAKKNKTINETNPQSEECGEHESIRAVKEQMGDEYQEDGPALGVFFDSPPHGAFVTDDLHSFEDLQTLPKTSSVHSGQVDVPTGLPLPYAARGRSSHISFPRPHIGDQDFSPRERLPPVFERFSGFIRSSSRRPVASFRQDSRLLRDSYHVPDLNSSMHLDEDQPSAPPLARYSKANGVASETSSTQSHSSGVAPAYGSQDAFMLGNSQNSGKEFSFPYCNGGSKTYSGAPVANRQMLPPSMPHSGLVSSFNCNNKKKRGREDATNERGIPKIRLKRRHVSKEETMHRCIAASNHRLRQPDSNLQHNVGCSILTCTVKCSASILYTKEAA